MQNKANIVQQQKFFPDFNVNEFNTQFSCVNDVIEKLKDLHEKINEYRLKITGATSMIFVLNKNNNENQEEYLELLRRNLNNVFNEQLNISYDSLVDFFRNALSEINLIIKMEKNNKYMSEEIKLNVEQVTLNISLSIKEINNQLKFTDQ